MVPESLDTAKLFPIVEFSFPAYLPHFIAGLRNGVCSNFVTRLGFALTFAAGGGELLRAEVILFF